MSIVKTKNRYLPLVVAFFLAVVCLLTPFMSANAVQVQGDVNVETFEYGLANSNWELRGDADFNEGKLGLRINQPNAWQPLLSLQKHQVRNNDASQRFTIEFDAERLNDKGWLGFALGAISANGHLYNAGIMFMLASDGTHIFTSAGTELAGTPNYSVSGNELPKGERTLVIEGEKAPPDEIPNSNEYYNLRLGIKTGSSTRYIVPTADNLKNSIHKDKASEFSAGNFIAMGVRAINHFGFCSMGGLLADITSFNFKLYGENDTLIEEYNSDFSEHRIAYTSEDKNTDTFEWALSATTDECPERAYFMGLIKEIAFKDTSDGAIVTSHSVLTDPRLDSYFDFSYELKLKKALPENGYFGIATGLNEASSRLDSVAVLYMKKGNGNNIEFGRLKDGTESEKVSVPEFALDSVQKLSVRAQYNFETDKTDLVLTLNDSTAPLGVFEDFELDGYFAVGAFGEGTVDLEVNDFTWTDFEFLFSEARDETIDFLGTETRVLPTETIIQPWYNSAKWFVTGTGVIAPRLLNRIDYDYLCFNVPDVNVDTPAFGTMGKYGDFVFRFTCSVSADSEFVAVTFANDNFESQNKTAPMIRFERVDGGMKISLKAGDTVFKTANGSDFIIDSETSFFTGLEDKYDVMLIVQNHNASLYYTKSGEAESYMPKVEFKNLPKTHGHIALTGNTINLRYNVTAFTVTNLSDYYMISDERESSTNVSDREINDKADIAFQNSYLNATRFKINGAGISVENQALTFSNTQRASNFTALGSFKNFQLNFDILAKPDADIYLTFGKSTAHPSGYSIRFIKNTANIELAGLANSEGLGIVSLPFNIFESEETVNVKLTVLGDRVALFLKRANQPVSVLSIPRASLKLLSGEANSGNIAFSAIGSMAIDNIRVRSLNYHIDIITEDRGGSNRPPMSNLTPAPETGCTKGQIFGTVFGIIGGVLALIGACVCIILFKKKPIKENQKPTNEEKTREKEPPSKEDIEKENKEKEPPSKEDIEKENKEEEALSTEDIKKEKGEKEPPSKEDIVKEKGKKEAPSTDDIEKENKEEEKSLKSDIEPKNKQENKVKEKQIDIDAEKKETEKVPKEKSKKTSDLKTDRGADNE